MSLATQGVLFGAHTPIPAGFDQAEAISALEAKLNRRLDVVNGFRKMGAPSGDFAAARKSLEQASSNGRIPLITWEPRLGDGTTGPFTLARLAAGEHDTYLRTSANNLAAIGRPIVLRPMHEMNGDWYHWSGNPELYKQVWRRIASIFLELAPNVSLAWCVNTSDSKFPDGRIFPLEDYWPGPDYVDILGVDGYNQYAGWRDFASVIGKAYTRICALDPGMPVWICETATGEADPVRFPASADRSKAEWIADMWATEGLPRIQALCWFNEKGGYDWPIHTSLTAGSTMRAQLRAAAGYTPPPGPYVPPVPDRVTATATGQQVQVTWRQSPTFTHGHRVYCCGSLVATVPKPATTSTITCPPGWHDITVTSFTSLRASRCSETAAVYVGEPL